MGNQHPVRRRRQRGQPLTPSFSPIFLTVDPIQGLKALEEKGVRGRFTSVDRLLEVDGKVEWM